MQLQQDRIVRSLMMVITPKHVGAVLMSILTYIRKLFLRQFSCVSVGEQLNFDSIKMVCEKSFSYFCHISVTSCRMLKDVSMVQPSVA
jgi:hypothetical protein